MGVHFGAQCRVIAGTLSMLLALDVLPSVFVGAHVLAELSSPTFGKLFGTSVDDLAPHEGYIRQLVDREGLDYDAVAERLRSEKSMRVINDVVLGYLKRLDASPAISSPTLATVADLTAHESYVRHLAEVEGLLANVPQLVGQPWP